MLTFSNEFPIAWSGSLSLLRICSTDGVIVGKTEAHCLWLCGEIVSRIFKALNNQQQLIDVAGTTRFAYIKEPPENTYDSWIWDFIMRTNCHGTALELVSDAPHQYSENPWNSIAKEIIAWGKEISGLIKHLENHGFPILLYDAKMGHSIVLLGHISWIEWGDKFIAFEKNWYSSPFRLFEIDREEIKRFTHFYQPDKSQ